MGGNVAFLYPNTWKDIDLVKIKNVNKGKNNYYNLLERITLN